MPAKTLDTKGLACPLPILKTKKALSEDLTTRLKAAITEYKPLEPA